MSGAGTSAGSGMPGVGLLHRLLPVLALLSVLAVTVLGGYAVAGALARPAGEPVAVGSGVLVAPLSGWEVAGRIEAAGARGVRITRGSATLDVLAAPFDGTEGELGHLYVDRALLPSSPQLSVSASVAQVPLGGGEIGARLAYVGILPDVGAVEGEVTAMVTEGGVGVVFDGWAPEGLLDFALDDLRTMVEEVAA